MPNHAAERGAEKQEEGEHDRREHQQLARVERLFALLHQRDPVPADQEGGDCQEDAADREQDPHGSATLAKVSADWQDDALPNMYIGGTGTVYNEYWNGDLAEMIVYARKLSDPERMQVEDYLGQKYGVAMTRESSLPPP